MSRLTPPPLLCGLLLWLIAVAAPRSGTAGSAWVGTGSRFLALDGEQRRGGAEHNAPPVDGDVSPERLLVPVGAQDVEAAQGKQLPMSTPPLPRCLQARGLLLVSDR